MISIALWYTWDFNPSRSSSVSGIKPKSTVAGFDAVLRVAASRLPMVRYTGHPTLSPWCSIRTVLSDESSSGMIVPPSSTRCLVISYRTATGNILNVLARAYTRALMYNR